MGRTPGIQGSLAFGKKVRDLRTSRGWTQKVLADLMGCRRQAISAYESGLVWPGIDGLVSLCRLLDTTPDTLLGFEPRKGK